MLDPHDRTLLGEALEPPAGYDLDYAVGATYSLDLTSLLAVPLAFTEFQHQDTDSEELDPVATYEALREHADNITIFCQAGQIHTPSEQHELFQLLEDVVVEVTAPSDDGAFHPKLWALRFTAPDEPVRYRVLCLSRNLTYARSWDTVVRLDGEFRDDRQLAYSRNHPLGDFIDALPDMAIHDLDDSTQETIDTVQDELRRVDFSPPDPFEEIEFHPFGIDQRDQWPFPDCTTDAVIVSPFLSDSLLGKLNPDDRHATLISRWEELDTISHSALEPWDDVYALDTAAELNPDTDPVEMPDADSSPTDIDTEDTLRNLHAKLFVVNDGWDARVYSGSANATHAAFNDNVEFLVELKGKKRRCGTEEFLGSRDDEISFRDLLIPYHRDEPAETDELREQLDDAIREVRREIATSALQARVAVPTSEDTYRLTLTADDLPDTAPHNASIEVRPITLEDRAATPITFDEPDIAAFDLSYAAITSFFAVHTTVTINDHSATATFVVNAPLTNAPSDRDQQLLRTIINNKDRFLRFLIVLLGDVDAGFGHKAAQSDWDDWTTSNASGDRGGVPLLEQLLRVLYQHPEQLDRIHSLITELEEVDATDDALPEGFDRIFTAIWDVYAQGGSSE